MKLNDQEKILIDIQNIRNIESITISDLHSVSNDNKTLILPSIIVMYDGGKFISLSAMDKYFDVLIRKVRQVYNDEKDDIRENSLADPFHLATTINIDERSKSILENRTLEDTSDIYKFYDSKCGYEESLLFEKDNVSTLISIIKYHLERFLSLTDTSFHLEDSVMGYKGNYVLSGNINGIDRYFPISYTNVDDKTYEIVVNGIFNRSNPIRMSINFLDDAINVYVSVNDYGLVGEYNYSVTNGVIKRVEHVTKNYLPVHYLNDDLEETICDLDNISKLDYDREFKWFRLPWGAYYGINVIINDVSDSEKIIENHNMFIDTNDNGFVRMDAYSLKYKRKENPNYEDRPIVLEEHVSRMTGTLLDQKKKIYIIETNFFDSSKPKGYYLTNLDGKYFYHIVRSIKGVKGIKRDELVSVDTEQIKTNADTQNKALVLEMVKGI